MTDEAPHDAPIPEKDALQGRLVGELKLELINASSGQNNRVDTARDQLKSFTFWVSVATLFAIVWYACEAHRQNCLLRQTVAQQVLVNRPVLLADPVIPSGTDANVTIVNFGKTVALEVTVPGEVISAPNDKPPSDPLCNPDREAPKEIDTTALAPVDTMPTNPSNYPVTWKWNGFGRPPLYAVGCAYYKGLDNRAHYTDICTKLVGDVFQACNGHARNTVIK